MIGCKRPLPPPSSYESVRAQYHAITAWTKIDTEDDLMMGLYSKRQRTSDHSSEDEANMNWKTILLRAKKDEEAGNHDHSTDDTVPLNLNTDIGKSKRPLFPLRKREDTTKLLKSPPSNCLSDQVNHESDRFTSSPNPDMDSRSGTLTQIWSTTSHDDAAEAHMLLNLTSELHQKNDQATGEQVEVESDAEQAKKRDEALGRERSRAMREKTLSLRQSASRIQERGYSDPTGSSRQNYDGFLAPFAQTYQQRAKGCTSVPEQDSLVDASHDPNLMSVNDADTTEGCLSELNLDTCQDYALDRQSCKTHVHNCDTKQIVNPFSRGEAENYRTQSRHLDAGQLDDSVSSITRPNENAIARLRRLTEFHQRKQPLGREAIILDTNPVHPKSETCYSAELSRRRVKTSDNSISSNQQYNAWNNHDSSSREGMIASGNGPIRSEAMQTDSQNIDKTRDDWNSPNLTPFQVLEIKDNLREQENAAHDDMCVSQSPAQKSYSESSPAKFIPYPSHEQLRLIVTLPSTFDEMSMECQDAILKHEGLKERRRDLDTIQMVMDLFARLWSLKMYDDHEGKWLKETTEFSVKVIDEKLYGKRVRDRMKQIADSLKRRLLKLPEPDKTKIQALMKTLLRHRYEILQHEVKNIEHEIHIARLVRHEASQKRCNNQKSIRRDEKGKQYSNLSTKSTFSHPKNVNTMKNGNYLSTPTPEKIIRNTDDKLTATQRKRQAQFAFQDRRLAALKDQLDTFHVNVLDDQNLLPNPPVPNEPNLDDTEMSEEDEGEKYYTGAGIQDSFKPTQQTNDALVEQIHTRAAQRSINTQQGSQLPDMSLASQNMAITGTERVSYEHAVSAGQDKEEDDTVQDFDDLSDEESIEGGKDKDEFCYRYVVSAIYKGFENFEDGVEYEFSAFLNVKNANSNVDEHVKAIVDNYKNSGDYRSDPMIEHRGGDTREGLRDWTVLLGQDKSATCRVRVTQEQYHPGIKAYEDARIHRACGGLVVYWVLWKKTLKQPPQEEVNEGDATLRSNMPSSMQKHQFLNEALTTATQECCSNESQRSPTEDDQKKADADTEMGTKEDVDDPLDELFGPDPPLVSAQDISSKTIADSVDPDESPSGSCTSMLNQSDTTRDPAPEIVLPPTPPPTSPVSPASEQHSQFVAKSTLTSHERVLEIHFNEIQQFTSVSLANRHAKNMYMEWYTIHMGGPSNEAFLRHEESLMEEDLKNCGDMSTWEREEDFEVEVHNGLRAIESYKVWVEKKTVKGPAN